MELSNTDNAAVFLKQVLYLKLWKQITSLDT